MHWQIRSLTHTFYAAAIFNASDYDFTFEDIILNHKILYVVMPGTKSARLI